MKVDMWVGVVCANVVRRQWPSFDTLNVVRRQWAILWYIVVWNLSCGVMYLGPLGFSWYYQLRSLIYYVSGKMGEVIILQIYTILCFYFYCGLYGGKESMYFWKCGMHEDSIACNLQQFLIWVVLCFQVLQIVILLNHSKSHYIWK